MNCLNPMMIKNPYSGEIIPTRCRHCVNCTRHKITELQVYAKAEQTFYSTLGRGSSFIRLSYNEVSLPVIYHGELKRLGEIMDNDKLPTDFYPTLLKSDVQKFWNRLRNDARRKYKGLDFSYIYCGELGSERGRPHYHLILFGIDTLLAKEMIGNQWDFGFIDYKPLKAGAVSYCAKYMYNDVFGEEKEKKYTSKGLEAPFLFHSVGFGHRFLKQEFMKNYMLDKEMEYNLTLKFSGISMAFPSYFRKKYNLKDKKIDCRPKEEVLKEAVKQAQNYVIEQRQRGVPVDDTSLRFLGEK